MALVNGDFETAEYEDPEDPGVYIIPGWSKYSESGGTVHTTAAAKRSGTYGLELIVPAYGVAQASQDIGAATPLSIITIYSVSPAHPVGTHLQVKFSDSGTSFDSAWQDLIHDSYTQNLFDLGDLGLSGDATHLTITLSANGSETDGIIGYIDDISIASGAVSKAIQALYDIDQINKTLQALYDIRGERTIQALYDILQTDKTIISPYNIQQIIDASVNNMTINFSGGSVAFTVGETVTGATTGASGVVVSFTVTSGSWGAGTAAGTVTLSGSTSAFWTEDLTGSSTGVAETNGTTTGNTPYIVSTEVSRSITEALWTAQFEIFDTYVPPYLDAGIVITMPDHLGNTQFLFYGVIPSPKYNVQAGLNSTHLTAYSYAYYLTKQHLTPGYRQNVLVNPLAPYGTGSALTPVPAVYMVSSLAVGETCYVNPRLWVTDLLLGTGLVAHQIDDNNDWVTDTSPYRQKEFPEFLTSIITKMEGIKKYADYLDQIFYDWVAGTPSVPLAYAYLVTNDSYDTLLDIPAEVTFTKPSGPLDATVDYVLGDIEIIQRLEENYNRISVTGVPGLVVEHPTGFAAGTVTFTLEQDALIGTCGAIVNGADKALTEIEEIAGVTVGQVTLTGLLVTDILYLTYKPATDTPYSPHWQYDFEDSGVTNGTVKPIEYPPVYSEDLKTQADTTAYGVALYAYLQTDANTYTVKLHRRTDLRLYQKVKFVGYSIIPETTMRITKIRYFQQGEKVEVTVELTADKHLSAQNRLKRFMVLDEYSFIQAIVNDEIQKELKDDPGTVIMKGGKIVYIQNREGLYKKVVMK